MPSFEIAPLEREHLCKVAELERACFSEPWSQTSLEMLVCDGAIGVVAICDTNVAAYGGMTVVLDEGNITNIAVDPDYRHMGMGRAVVRGLLDRAREMGVTSVFLEVRESNLIARSLYLGEGFEVIGIRKGFYRAPLEDAVMMVKRL